MSTFQRHSPERGPTPVASRIAAGVAIGLAFTVFLLNVHPFLAINEPVRADVLVVEGWVPDYVLDRAVAEFRSGKYRRVMVSGIAAGAGQSDGSPAARYLMSKGIDPAALRVALAPETRWNRTSHMARAVSHAARQMAPVPCGVNVITLGPHARQSRLAYRRMMGSWVPVGVIAIPKDDYDPDRWWASEAGIKKTTKDFAGWAKEWLFGLRN
ncbi:MAG: hypothetical protein U1F09_05640 [Steroidobacteraceae bacterium]